MATEPTTEAFYANWPLKQCRATKSRNLPAPHQKAALGHLNKWFDSLSGDKEQGGLLALPTGAGKTFTAVHFLCNGPLSDGYKVLWLAHTHHLLEQAFHCFSGEMLGHIREPRSMLKLRVVSGTPGHFPPRDIQATDDVVIATLQTITNAQREKLKPLRDFIAAAKGKLFVVFDEAHHAPAPSYRKLLVALQAKGAPVLGLTATPTYSDKTKEGWLKRLFPQGILAQARVAELIASGILAKPHFERMSTSVVPDFDEVDYQKWLGTYRDIPEEVIDHLARNAERNGFIASTYCQNRKKYGKTIIFTDRWYQCEAIVEALGKRGVKAGAVFSHVDAYGASVAQRKRRSRDENARALDRFRKGDIDVLVNVRMLTEGTDLPDAQTVMLTRQTTSQILLTQMVGRALRGPKFGGTTDAYIVSFIDQWQQSIRWAEYDPLADGQCGEEERPSPKRPPLQLISIELVKRLARQMDSGTNTTAEPFTALMPVGWFRVLFDACSAGGDEIEACDQLVMVFDDERKGFDGLIGALLKDPPDAFAHEAVTLDEHKAQLDSLRAKYFSGVARSSASSTDLLFDIFHVARHIAQGHGMPEFFPFEARDKHDLDALAKRLLGQRLVPQDIVDALRREFEKKDRFWRALFPNFDRFHASYDDRQRRLLTGGGISAKGPTPERDQTPSFSEPDEKVKAQVKRRDGNRCLACGAARKLEVDHIVASYHGGPGDIDNLQTLCPGCNQQKGRRTLRFTTQQTSLSVPPRSLEHFDGPDDASDRSHWERFLRRTINFTFQCAAVSNITIGGRGPTYYNWTIELVRGNQPSWLGPFLHALFEKIQSARAKAGKPEILSIAVTAPGSATVRFPVSV